eukprot:s1596_g16.t1
MIDRPSPTGQPRKAAYCEQQPLLEGTSPRFQSFAFQPGVRRQNFIAILSVNSEQFGLWFVSSARPNVCEVVLGGPMLVVCLTVKRHGWKYNVL